MIMKKLKYKDYIKAGNKCIATIYGWPYGGEECIATIVDGQKYTVNGNETERWNGRDNVLVSYERYVKSQEGDGYSTPYHAVTRKEYVDLCDTRPLRTVSECDEKDLRELFHDVCFGSMYLSDYNNDLDVDTHELMDVCEDYSDEVAEDHPDDWEDYLNEDDFVEYCMNYVCNMKYAA